MKAHLDTDGTIQILSESQEENEGLKAWIAQSFKDLENGFFPRIEIKNKKE